SPLPHLSCRPKCRHPRLRARYRNNAGGPCPAPSTPRSRPYLRPAPHRVRGDTVERRRGRTPTNPHETRGIPIRKIHGWPPPQRKGRHRHPHLPPFFPRNPYAKKSPARERSGEAGLLQLLGAESHPRLLGLVGVGDAFRLVLLPDLGECRLAGDHLVVILLRLRRPDAGFLVIADRPLVVGRRPFQHPAIERPALGARRGVLVDREQ